MWLHSEVKSLGDIPRHYARTTPDSPALIDADGPVSWSDLQARSNRVADAMLGLGVAPGDRVAYLGQNGTRYFDVLFGVSKVSAALLPLNWRLAPPELVAILRDATPRVLIADGPYLEMVRAVVADSGIDCRVVGHDSAHPGTSELDDLLDAASDEDPGVEVNPWATSVLMYTSGTTGQPKGVQLSHQNYLYLRLCEHLEPSFSYTREDVMLTVMPLFHAMGVGLSLQALYNGAAVAVYTMPDPGGLIGLIQRDRPTILPVVPTVLQMMLNHPSAESADFSSVRVVVYAGSPIGVPLLERALAQLDCDFIQFYGATETGAGVTFLRPDDHRRGVGLASVGSPLPLVDFRIADPLGELLPDGDVGEVLLRAPSVTTGYFNQPELTDQLFRNGWFHTGDAGYRDADGYIHIVDRVKDMIITGGENVYSTEVEQAVAQVEGVQLCAAVGVPDEKWGERIVAVVLADPEAHLTEEHIIAECRTLIAGYKVPKQVRFVDALPMTASGKVMKGTLREQLRDLAIRQPDTDGVR